MGVAVGHEPRLMYSSHEWPPDWNSWAEKRSIKTFEETCLVWRIAVRDASEVSDNGWQK
jgi:hypothetical protein